MPIEVKCSCGKTLLAPDNSEGKRGKCPACGKALTIARAAPREAELELLPDLPAPARRSVVAAAEVRKPMTPAAGDDDDYRIAPDPPAPPPPLPSLETPSDDPFGPGKRPRKPKICPSCQRTLPPGTKLCVDCGIDLKTGRSLRTSQGVDENTLYGHADSVAAVLSWIMPIAIFPIASDAFGKFKPFAIRCFAVAITLISVLFWLENWTGGGRRSGLAFGPWQDLMLWAGSGPNPYLDGAGGEFHWYQLLTNTFLHANVLHLAGNMLFLLVFGDRINALLGQWKSTAAYLLLAVAASMVFLISRAGQPIVPALGASGAIMGMAGMYFVLMPTSRIHMIAWWRWGFLGGFHRETNFFQVPGYGVLLFYIAFDVVATLVGSHDGTAHWAHLGGFICGIALAVVLLLTRQVHAQGADMISLLLGRHAWKILGTPAEREQ